MPEKIVDTTIAQQMEFSIRRLDSLSTLPSVATRFLSQILQEQTSTSDLAEIIESDSALAAKILSLIHQQGLSLSDEDFSIRRALDKLPAHLIRDAILSIKVFQSAEPDRQRALPRKQFALHCLAVACCAEDIAEAVSPPQIHPQLAYLAGLLHDIGKLALDQTMPKSFTRIIEEAKSQNLGACAVEQKHLGLDHTILGKRLARKWRLPNEIALAIWLHHNDTDIISQNMPEARIAQIVQLADSTARQCGIGQSGSYDSPASVQKIALSLALAPERQQQIRRELPERVAQKSKTLELDSANIVRNYCDVVQTTTAQLAQDNTKLSLENRQLQTTSSHFDFITDFLSSTNSVTSAIEIAENFAVRWQKFYQTGMVCLYLAPRGNSQTLEAVVVENLSQSRIIYLNAPSDSPPIPKAMANGFAILNAYDNIGWLFEQLDVDFDLRQTRLVPLLSGGKAIGALAFELRYPGDIELFLENFRAATSVAGAVLDMAVASQGQQRFAEQFARLLTGPKESKELSVPDGSLSALAEMAAGAAHELNNPLSVISGRAQLLADTEADSEKKQILKQIQENTDEISQIIEDLISFAEPPPPKPAQTNIKQILDEATQLAAQKTDTEHINIQIEIADGLENVFVDSAQIVSAIANIFSNSLESYSGELGPIKVSAEQAEGDFAKLAISDLGCGMDTETLQKATQPFFSAKPAGRKRGMGLAYATRLIQLNNGSLEIASEPGSGTTVTVYLPCK